MKVLVLANGDAPSPGFLRDLAAGHDLIIAADGAVHKAIACGITPQIVCGDFDSATLDLAKQSLPDAEYIPLLDQNFTDLEKALKLALVRGATEITIAGATGGRIDHALASLSLLLRYHGEADLRLMDEAFTLWVISGAADSPRVFSFGSAPGDTISLLALGEGLRVSITGVEWELDNEILPIGTRGISNVALGTSVDLAVSGGPLVVCRLHR